MTLQTPEIRAAKALLRKHNAEQRAARPKPPAKPKVKRQPIQTAGDGKQRQPRVRDKAYLGWVAGLPCLACYVRTGRFRFGVHVAHVRFSDAAAGWVNPGLQRKPSDDRCAPLCEAHHLHDQHTREERQFWCDLGVNAPDFCRDLRAAYTAGQDGTAVILAHGRRAA